MTTLSRFYVIYVQDLDSWGELDHTDDHKDQLVALEATLSLCVNKYHTSMTFGVTNTTLLSKTTDLDWQSGEERIEGTTFNTTTATHNGEIFWLSGSNLISFQNHLSLRTFTGTASMTSQEQASDKGINTWENDVAKAVAASLYDDQKGMSGLQDLLDNLAVSMSNAYNVFPIPFQISIDT